MPNHPVAPKSPPAAERYLQAKDLYDAAQAEASKSLERQLLIEKQFANTKAALEEYPKLEAARCLEQISHAKFIAETDADGLFKLRIPKKGRFVVLANAHRTIGDTQEEYWWFVPFSLDAQATGSITLSNDNELFQKDGGGAKVIDLRSKGTER